MKHPNSRILHLLPAAVIGGCEANCLRLIEGMRDCDHRVLVFDGTGPMSARWEAAGAEVAHLNAWRVRPRLFHDKLEAWLAAETRPGAVFYWSNSRLPQIIELLRPWGVPCAVHLGNPVLAGSLARLRRWLRERRHRAAPFVSLVACSQYVAADHRKAAYFRRFKTVVIYNAVPAALDQPRTHRVLSGDCGPRIGMIARLDRIKDHRTVIHALAQVRSRRPDLTIEFAGNGELRAALESVARRVGVADRVRFLGFANVEPLLRSWDVYIHATTDREGMGTALAEAMMAGLPCLVSDLPVMREVGGADGACYTPVADPVAMGRAMLELLADRERRERLGQAAQERARPRFSPAQFTRAYERVVFGDPAIMANFSRASDLKKP